MITGAAGDLRACEMGGDRKCLAEDKTGGACATYEELGKYIQFWRVGLKESGHLAFITRRPWDNIRMHLTETEWGCVERINMAQKRNTFF